MESSWVSSLELLKVISISCTNIVSAELVS